MVGFKSFVEPMEFVIEDGLTGVVGPNGCGKSNLVEAMRWVMGENSYKNMRASGMDDVIFSGSLNRPARNTAEVSLFLDNSDRTAPVDFNGEDTLEVSRRIEREAGSVYKVNGKDVRARDVQLLFADASTGARSPAMVRQGQIGELISAKPTARRQILEEAAGISGLHSRRKEAEIRLRAAEQNLERLEDILIQIDGQLDGLRRQARQASRYRNLSAEIRQCEAAVHYLRWSEYRELLSCAEQDDASAETELRNAAADQGEQAKRQAIAAHKVPQLREGAAQAAAALQRLVIARNELDAEDRRVRERLADLTGRLSQLAQDIQREEQMAVENGEQLEQLVEEEEELRLENEADAENAALALDAVNHAQNDLHAVERKLAACVEDAARAGARRGELERQAHEARERSQRLEAQLAAARQDLIRLDEEIELSGEQSQWGEALELAQSELLEAEEALQLVEEEVRETREGVETLRAPLSVSERKLSELETEARTLAGVLNVGGAGAWAPVVDQITAQSGYETALGAALGEDLEASLDVCAPAHWRALDFRSQNDAPLPEGVTPLVEKIDAPMVLERRLTQIGVVAAAEDGERLQAKLAAGQLLVSFEGHVWRWDGMRISAEAPSLAAQKLAQKNRLVALDEEINSAQELVARRRGALDEAANLARRAEEGERSIRMRVRAAQQKLDGAREAQARAERNLSQLTLRRTSLQGTIDNLEEEGLAARELIVESEDKLREMTDSRQFELKLAELRGIVAKERETLAKAKAQAEVAAREREIRDRRLEAIARERSGWAARAANAVRQIEVLNARRSEADEERQILLEAPEEIELKRRDLLSEIVRAEEARSSADDALAQGESALRDVDLTAKVALEALGQAREKKVRTEERLEAARGRKTAIEARITEVLEVSVEALPEVAGIREDTRLPDIEQVERRLERLKSERERLGGVNLRAEQELEEVDGQRQSLGAERDDLLEAIKRLRTGISNLNREARERLLKAFDVVNDHFQRLFSHLFGGGAAELQLVDSEDPLDAGLEILARPPGKKPQTMTLLSGGEQALTAMALIFAVFLTNPAPICVLDEVDAPLDDANVERYCDLLEEMTRRTETRFVVITHNPITMARMNRLFGVTMAERGVSQLVSVDLEVAESFLETG